MQQPMISGHEKVRTAIHIPIDANDSHQKYLQLQRYLWQEYSFNLDSILKGLVSCQFQLFMNICGNDESKWKINK